MKPSGVMQNNNKKPKLMNWKFWTWPAQIRQLRAEVEYQRELVEDWRERARQAELQHSTFNIQHSPLWSEPYDVTALKARLALLPADDKLFPLVLGYFDACIVGHAGIKVPPEMANQLAGKLNALDELRTDFRALWLQAHQPPKEKKQG